MLLRGVARSTSPYTDSLVGPFAWASNSLSFSFPDSSQFSGYGSGSEPFSGFATFNSVQRDAVRSIFASVSTFTNLTFSEMTESSAGNAVLRFGLTNLADPAHAFLPSDMERGGDSWYAIDPTLSSPIKGNYAYFTFLHEIGHALGLGHPFEDNGNGIMPDDREWMAYTVMSYRSSQGSGEQGYTNGLWDFAQSFMMEDIAVLQHMYGANYAYNSGDTIYTWDANTGQMFVNGGAKEHQAPRVFSRRFGTAVASTPTIFRTNLQIRTAGPSILGPAGGPVWDPMAKLLTLATANTHPATSQARTSSAVTNSR